MIAAAIVKSVTPAAADVLKRLSGILRSHGGISLVSDERVSALGLGYECAERESLFADSDLIFAVGGDGTMIHTAKRAAPYGKAILGINTGHLGFMAGLEADELEQIHSVLDGNYRIEQRMMLDVTVGNRSLRCLNDAVVAKGGTSQIIDIDVSCDSKKLFAFRGDGLIIATPTGSTAYSLSAGGPVVDPSIDCITVTPVCPHSLMTRPVVIHSSSKIEVTACYSSSKHDVYLTPDGEEAIKITGTTVCISGSQDVFARFIRVKDDSFCEVLNKKLTGKRI